MGRWFERHPFLRDALVWSIPAILFGVGLRLLFLSYSPLAYFGSDSRSYFGFAHDLWIHGEISLNEKRRFLYPLFVAPIAILPGGLLRWLPWLQAVLGVATILPVAYVVRRVFLGWRWFIVPVTVAYAGLPSSLWFEHEMLAECLFFESVMWTVGGWTAVVSQTDLKRAAQRWWWFFVPFAVMLLTKPAGRFLVPGLFVGLIVVGAWRFLRWRELLAGVLLFAVASTMGDDEQGVWLLYTSVFPLTDLESEVHADYKQEIRGMVLDAREKIDVYSEIDRPIFLFLRNPKAQDDRPLWRELAKDEKALARVYKELALEAIKADPVRFAYLSLQKVVRSANPSHFKSGRFEATYFAERFREQLEGNRTPESMLRLAFGLSEGSPLPPFEEFEKWICPDRNSGIAGWLTRYVESYQGAADLVKEPGGGPRGIWEYYPTGLGWWLLVAVVISLVGPWWRSLGVWSLTAGIYLFVVFLVGTQNVRYFAMIWPLMTLMLPLPVEVVLRGLYLRIRMSSLAPEMLTKGTAKALPTVSDQSKK